MQTKAFFTMRSCDVYLLYISQVNFIHPLFLQYFSTGQDIISEEFSLCFGQHWPTPRSLLISPHECLPLAEKRTGAQKLLSGAVHCTASILYFFLSQCLYLQRYNCVPRWITWTLWKTCRIRQKAKDIRVIPFFQFSLDIFPVDFGRVLTNRALLIDMLLLLIMTVRVLSPTPPFRWPYSRSCWQELSFMLDGAFNQASSTSAAFVGKCFMLPCMSLQVGGNIDLRCIVILSWNIEPCLRKIDVQDI